MTDNHSENPLRVTWGQLQAACAKAGIKEDDVIDTVQITWGPIAALKCNKDEDFGWQIVLDCDC